jgi:hypothetical protein
MNDANRTSVGASRHPGRVLLALGILVAVAGPVIYAAQLRVKVLTAPWYVPILATVGVVLLLMALIRSRSVVRWAAVVLFTCFAAATWVFMLFLMNAPAYNGPVKAGQPFPPFTTTLADGSPFDQDSLKGDQNTVMVFYRGHW